MIRIVTRLDRGKGDKMANFSVMYVECLNLESLTTHYSVNKSKNKALEFFTS